MFLEGVLSKENVVNIKKEIEDTFNEYNLLDVEISNVIDIDEYFLQLCYYFKLKYQGEGEKSISFKLCENDALGTEIEKAGFLELLQIKAS